MQWRRFSRRCVGLPGEQQHEQEHADSHDRDLHRSYSDASLDRLRHMQLPLRPIDRGSYFPRSAERTMLVACVGRRNTRTTCGRVLGGIALSHLAVEEDELQQVESEARTSRWSTSLLPRTRTRSLRTLAVSDLVGRDDQENSFGSSESSSIRRTAPADSRTNPRPRARGAFGRRCRSRAWPGTP